MAPTVVTHGGADRLRDVLNVAENIGDGVFVIFGGAFKRFIEVGDIGGVMLAMMSFHSAGINGGFKRIEGELAVQLKAYRSFSPNLPSNLVLDKPVNGPLSSKFGVRRFFNGEERNPHSGLDFAVPAGTPIKTPANGKVILVGNYFFNGNTVFVDHGQGFISMFCHMSKIDVKVGQQLARGTVVGKVGATGRATGPHMHWNVSLNDARVDPAIFIGAFQP